MRKYAILILAASAILSVTSRFTMAADEPDSIFNGITAIEKDPEANVSDWTIYSLGIRGDREMFDTSGKMNGEHNETNITYAQGFRSMLKNNQSLSESAGQSGDDGWITPPSALSSSGFYALTVSFDVKDVSEAFLAGTFQVYGTLVGILVNENLIYNLDSVGATDITDLVTGVSIDSNNDDGSVMITKGTFVGGKDAWNMFDVGNNTLTFIVANHVGDTGTYNPYNGAADEVDWGTENLVGVNVGPLPPFSTNTNTDGGSHDGEDDESEPEPEPTATPEPTTLAILACGILGGGLAMRRRKNQ